MNGQLNSNIYNASNNEAEIEELQNQIDSLNESVGSISEKLDETTEALNEYKTENKTQVSTAAIISNDASIDNLNSNTINGTTLCISGTSNQQTINATDVCATGIVKADRLYGNLIGTAINGTSLVANTGCIKNCLKVGGLDASYATINGSLTAGTFESDCIYNNGDATILGSLKSKGIELTNGTGLTGNSVEVNEVWANTLLCSRGIASIDCDLTVKGNITAKNVCGKVDSTKATITNATIDNLTVNNTLTVADGITLPNTLGDTSLTKVTTDSLIVNGDTELNGAVKAGSITIGDGSITAGEVCIGAKGVVIDKDKNAAFADVSSSNINAENIEVNTKINASCVESKDAVTENTFAKNFYPENITIDKDVGDLHYSYQLDTDNVGGILVDCKTVSPKEGATGVITKYKDTEANTISTDSVEYVNEKNGIKVVSCSTEDKTSNAITLDTGTNAYSIKADETGFGIYAGDEKAFGITVDGVVQPSYNICNTADNNVNNNIVKIGADGAFYCGCVDILGDSCSHHCTGNCYFYNCKHEDALGCVHTFGGCCNVDHCKTIHKLSADTVASSEYICQCTKVTDNRYDCCSYSHTQRLDGCEETYVRYDYDKNNRTICTFNELNRNTNIYGCYRQERTNCRLRDEIKNVISTCPNCLVPTSISRTLTTSDKVSSVCDELAWEVCINDSNLYITNPQRTTDTGCVEDILRVEDGKIYTKCGEFVAGGGGSSGGYFDDSTATICGEYSTYNLEHSSCICDRVVCVNTTITCADENCKPITFSYGYNSFDPFINVATESYNTSIDLKRAAICFASEDVCYINCPTSSAQLCRCRNQTICICCDFINKEYTEDNRTNGNLLKKTGIAYDIPDWKDWNDLCGEPVEIGCYFAESGHERCCLVYCIPFIGKKCSNLDYCDCKSDCACYDVPHYIFNASYDYSDCTYDWTEKRLIETCIYTSCPPILKYSKQQVNVCWECYYCPTCGDNQWQPKAYRCPQTDTCFYPVENGYRIDTTYNGCYQTKITTNTIANLPTTNTLVPLAGKVNGNGFAFFCKGSDGVKFYDSGFTVVDAGTATNITYLVTQGY